MIASTSILTKGRGVASCRVTILPTAATQRRPADKRLGSDVLSNDGKTSEKFCFRKSDNQIRSSMKCVFKLGSVCVCACVHVRQWARGEQQPRTRVDAVQCVRYCGYLSYLSHRQLFTCPYVNCNTSLSLGFCSPLVLFTFVTMACGTQIGWWTGDGGIIPPPPDLQADSPRFNK